MKFYGRERELQVLQEAFTGKESAFIPVYGRRRVGKSRLILEAQRRQSGQGNQSGKSRRAASIYLVGKQAPAELQRREFLQTAAEALNEPLLETARLETWREALLTCYTRFQANKRRSEKWILALDEFQWMAEASPELPSVLQECWDRFWKPNRDVVLLLCGSYIGFMEREVLGSKSPLFGRRTGQIHLQPLSCRDAVQFVAGKSKTDQALTYFLCGGIPYYLELFANTQSPLANVCRHLLTPNGALAREADFLLREELREVENYYAVLTTIANGEPSPSKIAAAAGIKPASVAYYLNQLLELGYVERLVPLDSGPLKKRKARYRLADPLLRFWFRFVFPNMSRIARGPAKEVLMTHVHPQLESYWGSCFEALCRNVLTERYDQAPGSTLVGEYWDASVQIDVVGRRETERQLDVGECKWGRVRSYPRLADELERKCSSLPNPENWTINPIAFVQKAPTKAQRSSVEVRDGGSFEIVSLENLF